MEQIEQFSQKGESNNFVKKTIAEGENYPVIDNKLKQVLKKYNLVFSSPSNKGIIEQQEGMSEKEIVIELTKKRVWPTVSYYNSDRSIRLSDHWNTDLHDKTYDENFIPDGNYAYVGEKQENGKWKIIERVLIYRASPVRKAEQNRHLKSMKEILLNSLCEVIMQNSSLINSLYDLRLSSEINPSTRGRIGNKVYGNLQSWLNNPSAIRNNIISLKSDIKYYENKDVREKIIKEVIEPIEHSLLTTEFIKNIEKIKKINNEMERQRYVHKGDISEYW